MCRFQTDTVVLWLVSRGFERLVRREHVFGEYFLVGWTVGKMRVPGNELGVVLKQFLHCRGSSETTTATKIESRSNLK